MNTKWEALLDERQRADIDLCAFYADNPYGADGHNRMMTIARLVHILDCLEEREIDVCSLVDESEVLTTFRQVETP